MFSGTPLCDGATTQSGGAAAKVFTKYFEKWLQQQYQDLATLRSAAEEEGGGEEEEERRLRPLIDGVISHYENYYRHKSASAKADVLPMFSPTWTTATENLFLWVGGWRPSVAIHLLYSKSGLQLESQLDRVLSGLPTRDLADLSPMQLERVDRLHRDTVRLKKEISEEEAGAQETVAGARMVEVAAAIAETGEGEEMMGPEMESRGRGMERVLERADGLRMETLRGVVGILRPVQAVHFLIAAAELHLRIHEFGLKKDEQRWSG